jgi:yeast amino acid transporter
MMSITGPAELSAAATLIDFWDSSINPGVWYTIFIVLIIIMTFCGVRVYGEVRIRPCILCGREWLFD